MTSNQIAYAQHLENVRANQAKEAETKRSNQAQELETRRKNVTAENLSRETNASKIRSIWGLASLAGERAVYGTDRNYTPEQYVSTGSPSDIYSTNTVTANPIDTTVRIARQNEGPINKIRSKVRTIRTKIKSKFTKRRN